MDVRQNVSLRDYSTMRLGGTASYLCDVHDRNEVQQATQWASEHKLPVVMIGGGSNIVWSDKGFSGLVLVNKILRFETIPEDTENIYITLGAGEVWDSVVAKTVQQGLTGIEALSLIPGSAGATPIQNVGAYGQEIADTLVSIEAYDQADKKFLTIPAADCGFGYRTSRFKTTDKGRFFIISVTLHLRHANPMPPFYPAVHDYFAKANIKQPTPVDLRKAVMAIRTAKLPDPAKVANCGSFFANPVIDSGQLTDLLAHYPNLHYWQLSDNSYKLAAAWLVEQAGFKDTHDAQTGIGTWPGQALVLINEHANSTASLLAFKQKIIDKVQGMFSITLVQEPEMMGEN